MVASFTEIINRLPGLRNETSGILYGTYVYTVQAET